MDVSTLNSKVIRFIIAGGINTVVWYIIYAIFIYVKVDFVLASFIATVVGIIFNFFIFKKFVFKKDGSIFILYIVYAVIYLEEIFVIWLCNKIGLNYYISGVIALFGGAVLSFVLNNNYVFKNTNKYRNV